MKTEAFKKHFRVALYRPAGRPFEVRSLIRFFPLPQDEQTQLFGLYRRTGKGLIVVMGVN
jgi:hypothetical protein